MKNELELLTNEFGRKSSQKSPIEYLGLKNIVKWAKFRLFPLLPSCRCHFAESCMQMRYLQLRDTNHKCDQWIKLSKVANATKVSQMQRVSSSQMQDKLRICKAASPHFHVAFATLMWSRQPPFPCRKSDSKVTNATTHCPQMRSPSSQMRRPNPNPYSQMRSIDLKSEACKCEPDLANARSAGLHQ